MPVPALDQLGVRRSTPLDLDMRTRMEAVEGNPRKISVALEDEPYAG